MEWTSQSAGLLARFDCPACRGTGLASAPAGLVPGDSGAVASPCGCVCRRVFQACYRRFRTCANADSFARQVTFREITKGVDRHLMWIRRNEDYCADFQSAARRALNAELFRVFRFYHLLGVSADLLARRLGFSPRQVFRLIGEVEEAVGREFAVMQPYSLYPPHEYMRGGLPANVA